MSELEQITPEAIEKFCNDNCLTDKTGKPIVYVEELLQWFEESTTHLLREPAVQPASEVRERVARELYEQFCKSPFVWLDADDQFRRVWYEGADRILKAIGTPATVQPQDDVSLEVALEKAFLTVFTNDRHGAIPRIAAEMRRLLAGALEGKR